MGASSSPHARRRQASPLLGKGIAPMGRSYVGIVEVGRGAKP
jgi:hypothetical protein